MNVMRRIVLLLMCLAATVSMAQIPDGKTVLDVMVKVNDYFMTNHPDPTTPTFVKRERPSNLWTRAVYFEGLFALYTIYPQDAYFDYIYTWGDFHEWKPRYGNTTRNADDYCCGQTYIDMFRICREQKMMKNLRAHAGMLVATPQSNDWWWVDAIQMGMPYLAKMGATESDMRYFDKALDMYMWTRNVNDGGLFNEEDGLWWRDPDFNPPYREPNGKNCYWSRGNGWAYAAIVRVLEEIVNVENHAGDMSSLDTLRTVLTKDFRLMSEALKECQREDGFWNCSLHDPDNYGGRETSGTALFVYGMAYGVRNGLIDRDTYLPVLLKAWNAIAGDAIHDDGFIGYVQGTGKEPKDGQPADYDSTPDFDDFATGCVLLAGSEVYKLNE